jgi:conjugative transfer signal peptidase TraF
MTAGVVLTLLSFPVGKLPKSYYLNLSPSVPLGVYRLTSLGTLAVGDLVVFDPPEGTQPYIYGRGWLPNGWPLIKYVGALAGETFSIEGASFYINNKYKGTVYDRDDEGRTLPKITGYHTVEPGMFLPVSPYSRSFDGRYFGTVPVNSIKGKASPLWHY